MLTVNDTPERLRGIAVPRGANHHHGSNPDSLDCRHPSVLCQWEAASSRSSDPHSGGFPDL